jgi:hypothetical protein
MKYGQTQRVGAEGCSHVLVVTQPTTRVGNATRELKAIFCFYGKADSLSKGPRAYELVAFPPRTCIVFAGL